MSSMRRQAVAGLSPGDTFVITRRFTRQETESFGDLHRDYNPVHYDQRFAQAKGFTGLICHGLLTAGMVCEIGGQVGWLASGMEFKFRRPVFFDDTITCRLTVTQVDDQGRAWAQAVFTNQHGQVVLEGSMSGRLPGPREREIMADMLAQGDPTNPIKE